MFCDVDGKPFSPNNIGKKFMGPVCKAAGLRYFHPHALRHTFAVLLIQSGVNLQYVSEQLGHSSIKITADVYGRLQPGKNIGQLDTLDEHTQTNANSPQTLGTDNIYEMGKVIDITSLRGKIVGSAALIDCYKNLTDYKEIIGYEWDKQGHLRPKPQTGRKRLGGF
jgi:hypothetical protein